MYTIGQDIYRHIPYITGIFPMFRASACEAAFTLGLKSAGLGTETEKLDTMSKNLVAKSLIFN